MICSICKRELRLANTSSNSWVHTENEAPLCDLGIVVENISPVVEDISPDDNPPEDVEIPL